MNLNLLEKYIENNDIDKAIDIINDISEKKYKEAVSMLIKYFEITDNKDLRNTIAIALSDIGCSEAVKPMIDMIRNPKSKGNRGTLLYALESLEYSKHIELFVDLLNDDNFEVSRHSLILIEKIAKDIPNEAKKKYSIKISEEIESLQDKIDFLTEALDVFEVE